MSHAGQKRKRPSQPPSLQAAVQSIFARAAHEELERCRKHQTLPSSGLSNALGRRLGPVPLPTSSIRLRHSLLSTLCGNLACVSKQSSPTNLLAVKKELDKHTSSKSEFISMLFFGDDVEDDDFEMAPPLCVIVHLLRNQCICLADVPSTFFVQRALSEIQQPNSCKCRPSKHQGIYLVVQYLLDGNRSSRCDAFLRQFFSVFFHINDPALTHVDTTARFQLANLVIQCLYEECIRHGEFIRNIVQWAQQTVIPSQFLDCPERDKTHIIWTPELSGLATHRKVDEYLPFRDSERDALVHLFKVIPAESAANIYLQCVNDIVKTDDLEDQKKDPVIGTWSRLILLGNRITDKKAYPDVDEALRRRVISSITGILCSSSCYSDPTSVAVVLCLARRALVSEDELSGSDEQAMERYYSWFRDLVASCDVLVVKGLLEPLTQLIPLESLHFLKLNHRVFSPNKPHFRLASDYAALVRNRIRDFGPTLATATDALGQASVNHSHNAQDGMKKTSKPSSKIMKEIVEHVVSYIHSKGKLPSGLVCQMNFNRYQFRKVILPLLLHPDFVVLRASTGEKVDLKMGPELFDERRLDIINEVAFKRNDQAITKAEAKAATKAIKKANKKREEEKKHGKIEQQSKLASEDLQESSGLNVVIEAILKDEAEHGFNATQFCPDGSQVRKAKDLLSANILALLTRCRNKKSELAAVSLDVLHNMCSAIESIELQSGRLFGFVLSDEISNENLLQQYSAWWGSTGRSLLCLVSHVVGDSRLAPLHVHLRYQLFALICCRTTSLSQHTIYALAMILAVLIILRDKSSLCDLCFVLTEQESIQLQHLAFVIFDNIPLISSEHVTASSMFIIECVFLLSAFSSSDLLGIDSDTSGNDKILRSPDRNELQTSSIADFIQPLMCVLRWVVSNPWRLNSTPHDRVTQFSINPPNEIMSSMNPRQVLLKAICALNVLGRNISPITLLNEVLSLELRCGWGKRGATSSFFSALKFSEMRDVEIIHTVSLFLAREASLGRDRKSSWIMLGLLSFHDQIRPTNLNLTNEESATFQVEQCLKRYGSNTAFQLLEVYCLLEFNYFQGCEDIDRHVQQILNSFWPFPKRIACYFVRLLKRVSSRRCHLASNTFFVANCAVTHESLVLSSSCSMKNGQKRNDLFRKINDISTVLEHLTNPNNGNCSGKADAMPFSQNSITITQEKVNNLVASVTFDHAFFLGISIGMFLGALDDRSGTEGDEKTIELVGHVASTIGAKVGKVACCDVLDCAIIACAMLPFGRVSDDGLDEDSARNELSSRTNVILGALLDERVSLCTGDGRLCPFWARDSMNIESSKIEIKNTEDASRVLAQWESQAASRCVTRILGTIGMVGDILVERFITCIGHETILSVVLPNLVWAYSVAANVNGLFGTRLRDGVVRAIKVVCSAVDHLVDGGAAASLAGRFKDTGVEIVSLFQSGVYG